MKFITIFMIATLPFIPLRTISAELKKVDISNIISKEVFLSYKDVADFIDDSPKVTIIVKPNTEDINEYGAGVMKSLTGSDCDRDGVMDDNATCNKIYLQLWLKYKR